VGFYTPESDARSFIDPQEKTIMETRYEPHTNEKEIYAKWLEANCFKATPDDREPYCITIPPPNVTGALHMGHALNHTIMDTLGRWKRMRGYNVLILPGTDHAGIATQSIVEKMLQKNEKKSRHDLGREAFLGRVWEWKNEYGDRIVSQMQRMGCSYDWERLRFTMDDSYVDAILTVFEKLYKDGYIYLGERIVNWSPPLMTVISDIEVNDEEEDGFLWHISYPLTDGTGAIIVATTRPETLLGDTAVAVHPDDERYKALVGKTITLPLTGRQIPIIADDFVKQEFGSGAVKVTPFHDPNDYECGLRHNLPRIEVIGPNAKMTAEAGTYAGQDRFVARKNIVADLETQGFLIKTEPYRHTVPHCDRSGAVVEPRVSKQWFCKMSGTPMVDTAIKVVQDGDIKFIPERYNEMYVKWLENIRDWPISRQLWWGHRIPVWRKTNADPENISNWICATSRASAEAQLGTTEVTQSEDVLDTWFSSALWPFATLGWPKSNASLDYYYPTSLLSTAQEILYLWVARMVMTGELFMGEKPFNDVYIHATILDEHGRRMSKSKQNGIDPVDLIDLYGADAMRFFLASQAGQRQDIRMKPIKDGKQEQVEVARNFCNKIWNASRFAIMNLGDAPLPPSGGTGNVPERSLLDRWILSRLSLTTETVNTALETYNLDDAARALYAFFWDDFCDWYIEGAKPALQGEQAESTRATLSHTLDHALRLLHPILPYLTEAIWQNMPGVKEQAGVDFLMFASFPTDTTRDLDAERDIEIVQEITRAIRNIQAENQLKKGGDVFVTANSDHAQKVLTENQALIEFLTRFTLKLEAGAEDGFLAPTKFGDLRLPRPEATTEDIAAEKGRIEKELEKIGKEKTGIEIRLADPNFAARAPEAVVIKTRAQMEELSEKEGKLRERLGQIG
jgi:valyl-tRNA synthetase